MHVDGGEHKQLWLSIMYLRYLTHYSHVMPYDDIDLRQLWLGQRLGTDRHQHQAITRASVGPDPCRLMASTGHNVFMAQLQIQYPVWNKVVLSRRDLADTIPERCRCSLLSIHVSVFCRDMLRKSTTFKKNNDGIYHMWIYANVSPEQNANAGLDYFWARNIPDELGQWQPGETGICLSSIRKAFEYLFLYREEK